MYIQHFRPKTHLRVGSPSCNPPIVKQVILHLISARGNSTHQSHSPCSNSASSCHLFSAGGYVQ